ncbi:MAG: CoA transferase [Actinobacteria bacterium]|nr:CoA transferase [Actinomycetota bacterium]MCB8995742.1 CoA transferase [Actinomycetota bacterium]MCB9414703.1 CoA transferase [Actinomycetota bacterium]MCB9424409.1 CoA transferase [Actinomycetota bacterium]
MSEAPLAGVRVLDMTRLLPGNFATVMLAEMGADVVKIEAPEGDGTRWVAPHLPSGESGAFVQLNRGKSSRVVDLKTDEGRSAFSELVRGAHVLVDSFRPGVLDRLGFGPDDLKRLRPDLVHVTIDAYGSGGELEQVPGHDLNAIGYAGVLTLGGTPALPGLQVADLAAGMHAALAVLAGLRRSAHGQFVHSEVAMVDAALTFAQLPLGGWLATGQSPATPWDLTGRWACYGVYECADGGWLTVGALEPKFFAAILDRLDLGEWKVSQYDPAKQAELTDVLRHRFASRPRAHWLAELAFEDTCVGPALTLSEAMAHPNLRARSVLRQVQASDGTIHEVFAALPWLQPEDAAPMRAPGLGEH